MRKLCLLASAGGVVMALCWLPLGLAPALPLSLLLFIRGLRHAQTSRQAILCGMLWGGVFYAVGSHFLLVLVRYSPLGVVIYLMAIAFTLPFSAAEAWAAFKLEDRFGLPRSVGLALVYPLLEKVRTVGDMSFPADLLTHIFGTHPSWLAWNPWIGPYGFSLLAFGVALILDQAIEHGGKPARAVGVALAGLALWLAAPASDPILNPRFPAKSPGLRVGIVQPFVKVRDKLDRERWPKLRERLEELTLHAAEGADLVLWPETVRPGPVILRDAGPYRDPEMEALATRAGVPILYGAEIAHIAEGEIKALYNGAAMVRPAVEGIEWYGKQQLLPFIEGVPFARLIGWDPAKRKRTSPGSYLTLIGNFAPGPRPTIFEVGPARIGVLVCYEGMYPQLGRRYRLEGANTLAVITNDAWWGRSAFAPWHARMVAGLARSLNLPVIRAANSGVSSATDRWGRMTDRTKLDEVTTLQLWFEPAPSSPTFFARSGDLALWGILGFLAIFITVSVTRRTTPTS